MRGPDSTTRTTYTESLGKEEDYTDLTRVGVQVSVLRRSVMRARERPRGGAGAKVLLRAGHRRDAERSVTLRHRLGHPVRAAISFGPATPHGPTIQRSRAILGGSVTGRRRMALGRGLRR